MPDLGDRWEGARCKTERDRDLVKLVVAAVREPRRFDRDADELSETSTDLRPRTPVARERRQEHTTRPDDTHDLAVAGARIGADRATGPAPDEPPHAEELPDTPGPLLEAVPDPSTRPEPDVVPGVTGLPGAPAYEREILTSVERTRTGPARLPGRGR